MKFTPITQLKTAIKKANESAPKREKVAKISQRIANELNGIEADISAIEEHDKIGFNSFKYYLSNLDVELKRILRKSNVRRFTKSDSQMRIVLTNGVQITILILVKGKKAIHHYTILSKDRVVLFEGSVEPNPHFNEDEGVTINLAKERAKDIKKQEKREKKKQIRKNKKA